MKIRYGWGNVRSGKYLSGEMSGRGSLRRGSVQSENCPVGEVSPLGNVSLGYVLREVSVGELSGRETVLQSILGTDPIKHK